jgi:molybdopterin converting factor small subunit
VARVSFTRNLERHIACPTIEVEGGTVAMVLDGVFETNPKLRSYLLDDQGRLRKHVNVFVNNERIADRDRLSDPVGDSDQVFVFQALSGG